MIEATFDVYATDYEQKFNLNRVGRYQRKRIHRVLANLLSPGSTLLDVGCGPGSDFGWYGSRGLLVTALDISNEMVKLAKEQSGKTGLDAEVHHLDFFQMPEDRLYDAILLNFGVINAMPDIVQIQKKLKRLLAPGGRVIIVTMPPLHLFSALGNVCRLRFSSLYGRLISKTLPVSGGMSVHYYSKNMLPAEFEVLQRVHLASVLPTPDQFANHEKLFIPFFPLLKRLDKYLAERLPEWVGGDHVCYVFARRDDS
ncbi:MAG: class I SAM-dependent methyltransferase [Calditrichia bacterium]